MRAGVARDAMRCTSRKKERPAKKRVETLNTKKALTPLPSGHSLRFLISKLEPRRGGPDTRHTARSPLVRVRVMEDSHCSALRPRGRPRGRHARLIVRCFAREVPFAMGSLKTVCAALLGDRSSVRAQVNETPALKPTKPSETQRNPAKPSQTQLNPAKNQLKPAKTS